MINKVLKEQIQEVFDSQANFSNYVKEHESVISRVIQGRRQLRFSRQRVWAALLKCRVEDIFLNNNEEVRR